MFSSVIWVIVSPGHLGPSSELATLVIKGAEGSVRTPALRTASDSAPFAPGMVARTGGSGWSLRFCG